MTAQCPLYPLEPRLGLYHAARVDAHFFEGVRSYLPSSVLSNRWEGSNPQTGPRAGEWVPTLSFEPAARACTLLPGSLGPWSDTLKAMVGRDCFPGAAATEVGGSGNLSVTARLLFECLSCHPALPSDRTPRRAPFWLRVVIVSHTARGPIRGRTTI